MVAVGETVVDVDVTAPTFWSIDIEVAPVTAQVSVADCPGMILVGAAVKLVITGRFTVITVTLAVPVTEPSALVAFMVYVVVVVGVTACDPDADTTPIFWSIDIACGDPVTLHCKVADWPEFIEAGVAVKDVITGNLLVAVWLLVVFSKIFPLVASISPIPAITTRSTIITIPMLPSDFAFPPGGLPPR